MVGSHQSCVVVKGLVVGVRRRQHGFSLMEMLIVVVLLAIALPALLVGFTTSYITVKDARMLEVAKHVGQILIERALTDEYPEIGEVQSPIPGYTCRVDHQYNTDTGATVLTVTVSYPFLAGIREYRTVAVRYGRIGD